MIELTFLKKLILVKQVQQKNVIFVTIVMFKIKGLSFTQVAAMDAMIY